MKIDDWFVLIIGILGVVLGFWIGIVYMIRSMGHSTKADVLSKRRSEAHGAPRNPRAPDGAKREGLEGTQAEIK